MPRWPRVFDAADAPPASERAAARTAATAAERRKPRDWMWDELDMAPRSEAVQTGLQRRPNGAPTSTGQRGSGGGGARRLSRGRYLADLVAAHDNRDPRPDGGLPS